MQASHVIVFGKMEVVGKAKKIEDASSHLQLFSHAEIALP